MRVTRTGLLRDSGLLVPGSSCSVSPIASQARWLSPIPVSHRPVLQTANPPPSAHPSIKSQNTPRAVKTTHESSAQKQDALVQCRVFCLGLCYIALHHTEPEANMSAFTVVSLGYSLDGVSCVPCWGTSLDSLSPPVRDKKQLEAGWGMGGSLRRSLHQT